MKVRYLDIDLPAPLGEFDVPLARGWEVFQVDSIGSSLEGHVCVRVWLRKL